MSPQLLILSVPRTGTQSLAEAVQLLGYDPCYHMREVLRNGHTEQWARILNTKADGNGSTLTREDFESVLGNYQALADFPAAVFASELMTLYPEAKIIITQRDEDSWVRSVNSIDWQGGRSDEEYQRSPMQPVRDAITRIMPKRDDREFFRKYYADAQEMARAQGRPVLLFEVGKHGWAELCEFLGKDVPAVEYPRKDDLSVWKKK